jgi:hypothetical protein
MMFSSTLVTGPWRTTGKDKVNAEVLCFFPNSGDREAVFFMLSLYPRSTARLTSVRQEAGAKPMWIMVVYVLIVVVSELIVVGIGLALDRIAPIASLPVSLTLFFAVLWFGWLLAVRWTEPKHGKKSKLVAEN